MRSAREIEDEFLDEVDQLLREGEAVFTGLVLPQWGGDLHGYPRTLYGLLMNSFALADRLSFYFAPRSERGKQTERLRAFYRSVGATPDAAAAAVQIWRHTLMHTGLPAAVTDTETGISHRWLLHWGEPHLPREQHMTVVASSATDRVLNVGAIYLAEDLRREAMRLFGTLHDSQQLRDDLCAADAELAQSQDRPFGLAP